jgi:hypothetical protein
MILSADLSEAKRNGRMDERNANTSSPGRSSILNKPLSNWPRRSTGFLSGYLMLLITSLWIVPTSAVFLEFQNCLSDAIQNDQPLALQIIPLYLNAVFNTTDTNHNLDVTVWGNVTGSTVGTYPRLVLPSSNDTQYWATNETSFGGKIENEPYPTDASPKLTTLSSKVNVLTYEPWHNAVNFCEDGLLNGTCPLGPTFNANL